MLQDKEYLCSCDSELHHTIQSPKEIGKVKNNTKNPNTTVLWESWQQWSLVFDLALMFRLYIYPSQHASWLLACSCVICPASAVWAVRAGPCEAGGMLHHQSLSMWSLPLLYTNVSGSVWKEVGLLYSLVLAEVKHSQMMQSGSDVLRTDSSEFA